jgi:hypothetical protein
VWVVSPGVVQLIVQVEQSDYIVDPLRIEFEIDENTCANLLLRQARGYELVPLSMAACP